jgi:hypothetical protein
VADKSPMRAWDGMHGKASFALRFAKAESQAPVRPPARPLRALLFLDALPGFTGNLALAVRTPPPPLSFHSLNARGLLRGACRTFWGGGGEKGHRQKQDARLDAENPYI